MDGYPVLPKDKSARRRWLRRYREIDDLLSLVKPSLDKPLKECSVVDLGCGPGSLSIPIARRVESVVGVDDNARLIKRAKDWADKAGLSNTRFETVSIFDFAERERFDLAICSDVLEHVSDQRGLIDALINVLRVGGAFYMTTNNKLWPLEGHHRLPFLSYLPRGWADRYVRFMGKGEYFRIYPLTLSQLKELLSRFPVSYELKPPRNPKTLLYRMGKRLVEVDEMFWNLANAFQVTGVRLK
jgi:2-polyprenyl-3-methyl-5-hydroxy-6-metoxy-1,4-benzoquinol methylase